LKVPGPDLRAPDAGVPQDWRRLQRYLAASGLELSLDMPPQQFAGGLANLNYLLHLDGREVVLRRPPLGVLPPGAYDMGREHRILRGLWKAFPLAPQGLHVCEEPDVLGAPFQLTEFRRGFSVRSTLPAALACEPEAAGILSRQLINVLVKLHAVDPVAADLSDLGKPQGFLERAVEGWARRAGAAQAITQEDSRVVTSIVAWLREHRAPDGDAVLLHNDIKLDNVLLDEYLQPVAVLDWDQGTRGDALFDLATTLSYWSEHGDPPVMHDLAQMPTAAPGFMTRREFAQAYADATGRDLSDFKFRRVLAMFKLAIIFMQLHARWKQGATSDARYAGFGALTAGLLDFTWAVARDEAF
jgi:aminoglycoside phosphotransferase (APT) family kinase protein